MSCEISSAVSASDWYSAAIQTSAASSTIFLPLACTPASNSATVPEPSGRVVAFSLSSANRPSKDFTLQGYRLRRVLNPQQVDDEDQGATGQAMATASGTVRQVGRTNQLPSTTD